ncbi:MAG: VWA domain-containing protein [Pseudomonadota bacterium]
MSRRKRSVDPISMSFLDVISCGFGAVILLFMVMKHSTELEKPSTNPGLRAEISMLDEEILEGQEGLVRLRNTMSDVDMQSVQAQGLARSIQEQIDSLMEELAEMEDETLSEDDAVEKLKADIASLEDELERLKAKEEEVMGNNIRAFVGDGNRQYLTGLILGGNRILILVDISGSMLDDTIVNIIRRRNMPEAERLNSAKWVQVRKTVDWLTTQLPVPSQYQIYVFNNQTRALLPGTEGQWLEVADDAKLNDAINNLNETIPAEGTNLEQLFASVKQMNPLPDNIYLITDGLPTLGNNSKTSGTITGRDREELFERAMKELPKDIPVNVILEPLEGDPMAAGSYWQLAVETKGSFLMPSPDWP